MGTPYKTFSYHTFGCKVNFADSSYIARQVINKGLSQVSIDDYADICLINTCSVTEKADKKAKKLIKTIHNKFPETKIVVFGCYAQLQPEKITNLEGVAAVISTENKFDISNIIYENDLNDSHSISDIGDVESEIVKLVKEKPGLSVGGYMGLIMQKFKGKVNGKEVNAILNKLLK